MKYIYRVARREFAENAATKGFWIGMLLFPIMILVAIEAQVFLQKATPTRHFVVVDQSGNYSDAIDEGIERVHLRHVATELQSYLQKHLAGKFDPEQLREALEQPMPKDLKNSGLDLMATMIGEVGLDAVMAANKLLLPDDVPAFEEPKAKYVRVGLPDGLGADSAIEEIVEALRPYLKGAKMSVDGKEIELFAAILIPPDADSHVSRPLSLKALVDQAMNLGNEDEPGDLDDSGAEEAGSGDGAGGEGLAALSESRRRGVQYWASNLADNDLSNEIEKIVNNVVREQEYADKSVDSEIVKAIQQTKMPFSELNPKKEVGKEEVSVGDKIRQYSPIAFVYLLWVGIFTISQMLLNNTIEEKSNRIIEVLLSSVTASELMLGKLLGIAMVGITMLSSWIVSLLVILEVKAGPEAELATQLLDVLKTSGLLPSFAVYFVLGYFMYAGLFLSIGSVCNTLKEAQNLMGPVMLIMIVPLITMMFIPKDPNGTLATVLSWIPLYTPFLMMNRAAADPPLFDIVGTGVLLLLTTLGVMWMTGKIFRIGILRTGQPPKLLEVFRWLRGR